jgi:Xaa-Pro aminopeptidase
LDRTACDRQNEPVAGTTPTPVSWGSAPALGVASKDGARYPHRMSDTDRRIPESRYAARLATCREAILQRGFAGLLLGVGPDLQYLAGFANEPTERLMMLVIPAGGDVSFVVPRLEATRAETAPVVAAGLAQVVPFEETDDSAALVADLVSGMSSGRPVEPDAKTPIGVSDRLWALHVLRLQTALPGRRFEPASAVLRELRQVKDADEARLLQLAAAAADRTMDAVASGPLVGRTEAAVNLEIRRRLTDEGHDVADFAIVGSGPNGASPHHDAGERTIREGEPVVLDIGGSLGGYFSDTTRTIWVAGEAGIQPEPEFRRVYDLVREAQAAATAAVRPGITAEAIDSAGRGVIAAAGYGEQFTHRTGHGIGLEVHEDPYVVAGNATSLQPGMAFSVEPGVYLPGRWGVRLENIVMCTAAGSDVLNRSSLDLRVARG